MNQEWLYHSKIMSRLTWYPAQHQHVECILNIVSFTRHEGNKTRLIKHPAGTTLMHPQDRAAAGPAPRGAPRSRRAPPQAPKTPTPAGDDDHRHGEEADRKKVQWTLPEDTASDPQPVTPVFSSPWPTALCPRRKSAAGGFSAWGQPSSPRGDAKTGPSSRRLGHSLNSRHEPWRHWPDPDVPILFLGLQGDAGLFTACLGIIFMYSFVTLCFIFFICPFMCMWCLILCGTSVILVLIHLFYLF